MYRTTPLHLCELVEERPVPAEPGAQQLGVSAVSLPRCAKALLPPLNGRDQRLGYRRACWSGRAAYTSGCQKSGT
jgi:hypothetical protein